MAPPAWAGPRTVPCHPASAPAELVIVPRHEYVSGSPCGGSLGEIAERGRDGTLGAVAGASAVADSSRMHGANAHVAYEVSGKTSELSCRYGVSALSGGLASGGCCACGGSAPAPCSGAWQPGMLVLQVSSPGSCPGDCRLPGCCAFAVRPRRGGGRPGPRRSHPGGSPCRAGIPR